jgi:hypothetical protein
MRRQGHQLWTALVASDGPCHRRREECAAWQRTIGRGPWQDRCGWRCVRSGNASVRRRRRSHDLGLFPLYGRSGLGTPTGKAPHRLRRQSCRPPRRRNDRRICRCPRESFASFHLPVCPQRRSLCSALCGMALICHLGVGLLIATRYVLKGSWSAGRVAFVGLLDGAKDKRGRPDAAPGPRQFG